MEILILLLKTLALRPYVFLFLAFSLHSARQLIGWRRTGQFFVITWITALICELSSTRTGIPFGWYYYTMSTVGEELYLFNVPFMDSLSFSFLLYASYCMTLAFVLPAIPAREPRGRGPVVSLSFEPAARTSWPALGLTVLFYAWIDMVIDPVALRGDRWFLGRLYYYPEPGVHFGVPLANYGGWAIVGLLSLTAYFFLDRRGPHIPAESRTDSVTSAVVLGCGLYYAVLLFNLAVTFWIGESLLGIAGVLMYIPVTVLLVFRLYGLMPEPAVKN
jgi:putative membrane protein